MTELHFVVPARRAVVRTTCTYDAAMRTWLDACVLEDHVSAFEGWYGSRRPASAPLSFGKAWARSVGILRDRWSRAFTLPDLEAFLSPGVATNAHQPPPYARLWKGPLRVLLEQAKYGVLGRTVRTDPDGVLLVPAPTDPMMATSSSVTRLPEDGVLEVSFAGETHFMRQNTRGEVTHERATFLPGDVIEFPFFQLLALAQVDQTIMSQARFNPSGSPFLGTSVLDGAGEGSPSPGRVRIHDNLIAMRFQLHLNMTRGAYSSLRPVMNGPLVDSTNAQGATNSPTPQNPEDMNDDQLIRYVASVQGSWGERMDVVRLARPRPAYTAAQRLAINTAANRLAQQLRRIEAAQLRAERARARQEAADARLAEEQARAALRTATPAERERLERAALAAERAAERAKAADRSLGRLRADYGALCNQAELHPGTRVYARGLIYGGSLQSTPPVGYGTGHAYRYGSPNWGTMNAVPSYRAWGSIPAGAESQRLTASWVCTSATLATSYYMLHATNGGGGSLRSHVDSRASALFSSDPDGPHAAKFVRFMSYAGDPARDEHAIPELIGSAGTELRAFLETQVRSDDNPAFLNQAIRKRDTRQALDVPISLPQLRDYFLGRYRAAYTVVTMSAHEYMLFWLWPHDKLLREPPQDGDTVPAFELPPASSASDRAAELPAAFGVGSAPPDPSSDASGSVLDVGPPRDVEDSPDEEQFYDADPLISVRGTSPSTLDRARTNLFAGGLTPLVGHGPPVAGFIAAYNPSDPPSPPRPTALFTYEASGVVFRIRYRRVTCRCGRVRCRFGTTRSVVRCFRTANRARPCAAAARSRGSPLAFSVSSGPGCA
jgi:hypothetical protein